MIFLIPGNTSYHHYTNNIAFSNSTRSGHTQIGFTLKPFHFSTVS